MTRERLFYFLSERHTWMESDIFIAHYGFVQVEDDETKIPMAGGMTIAIDDEGWVGWSICNPCDNFSRKIGIHGGKDRKGNVIPGALARLREQSYREPGYEPERLSIDDKNDLARSIAEEILYSKSRLFDLRDKEIEVISRKYLHYYKDALDWILLEPYIEPIYWFDRAALAIIIFSILFYLYSIFRVN